MPQLSAICISLVIVSVLVQNANGKRGCAAFGHACYGGHGKRSSSLPEGYLLGGGSGHLNRLLPIPYAKMSMMDRSKSLDVAPELRSMPAGAGLGGETGEIFAAPEQPISDQDKFERGVRFAMNTILRQLLEENRQQQAAALQSSEAGQQHLMDNEKK